jgi:hypothetical protein
MIWPLFIFIIIASLPVLNHKFNPYGKVFMTRADDTSRAKKKAADAAFLEEIFY